MPHIAKMRYNYNNHNTNFKNNKKFDSLDLGHMTKKNAATPFVEIESRDQRPNNRL